MAQNRRRPKILFLSKKNSENALCDMNLLIEGLLSLDVDLIVPEESAKDIEEIKPQKKRATIIGQTPESIADMVLIVGEMESKNKIQTLIKQGAVPVLSSSHAAEMELIAFNPVEEKGVSFIFNETYHWDIFAAIVRALETYNFPYDWKNIVTGCKTD